MDNIGRGVRSISSLMAMRTRSIARGAAALAAAVTLVLSAGCGSGANEPKPLDPGKNDEPNAQDPTPTDPDPTKPEPTVPTPTGDLETQLLQVSKNFYSAVNEGFRQLDMSKLQAISTPECGACSNYVDYVDSIKKSGQHFSKVAKYYAFSDFEVAENTDSDQSIQNARFKMKASAAEIVDKEGKVVDSASGVTKFSVDMIYVKEGDKWLVTSQHMEEE